MHRPPGADRAPRDQCSSSTGHRVAAWSAAGALAGGNWWRAARWQACRAAAGARRRLPRCAAGPELAHALARALTSRPLGTAGERREGGETQRGAGLLPLPPTPDRRGGYCHPAGRWSVALSTRAAQRATGARFAPNLPLTYPRPHARATPHPTHVSHTFSGQSVAFTISPLSSPPHQLTTSPIHTISPSPHPG